MRVMIAGGGTAGHINPGIAIAKKIKKENPKAEILFVGTKRGLEQHLVPKEGFHIEMITVKGFKRKLSLDTLKTIKELFQGLHEARRIIKKFKPDIVIGTGGYVCGPVLFHASLMGVPTMLHEQNAYPSLTNRILSPFVKKIAISFEEAKNHFPVKKKLVLTGNPIRPEILETSKTLGRKKFGFKMEEPLVLIFGGSQGAEKINEAVMDLIETTVKKDSFQILFSTGQNNYEKICQELKKRKLDGFKNIQIHPYIYNMQDAMAAADLAVVRAGALTIAELTALGIPSIMIPLPTATNDHQLHNAKVLEKKKACVLIEQKFLTGNLLNEKIKSIIRDKAILEEMSLNSKMEGIIDADKKIYDIVKEILNK